MYTFEPDQDDLAKASYVGEQLARLTPRESQVLALLLKGLSNKQAGRALDISGRTVEVHRHRILEKTWTANVIELGKLVTLNYAVTNAKPAPRQTPRTHLFQRRARTTLRARIED